MATATDQRRTYVIVQPGSSCKVSFQGPTTSVSLRVIFPLKYTSGDLQNVVAAPVYTSAVNPYLQTAEFTPDYGSYNLQYSDAGGAVPQDATTGYYAVDHTKKVELFNSGTEPTPVLLISGTKATVTALEIVTLPIAMFNTHGDFYTRQGYYWIFIIVGGVLSTLYVAFARVRVWQAVLAYSMGAFAVVFCEKLYHAILATTLAGTAAEIAYMFVCIVFLAEAIPFFAASIIMRQARCRAVPWGIVGLLFAVGFLFLAGSGWFVGVGLLGVASLLRILSRALL